jgi:Putative bacterial sensory transduction regulator
MRRRHLLAGVWRHDGTRHRRMTAPEGTIMSNEMITAITPAALAEHLKNAGYRATVAEQNGLVYLTSASQGVGFIVRFGNPADLQEGSFLDYSFSAALQLMGEPPAMLASTWNRTRRFARLSLQGQLLVMDMDITVAGGVTARNLRAQIELWDRLMQELLLYVRDGLAASPQPANQAPANQAPANQAPANQAPANQAPADMGRPDTVAAAA